MRSQPARYYTTRHSSTKESPRLPPVLGPVFVARLPFLTQDIERVEGVAPVEPPNKRLVLYAASWGPPAGKI